MAPTVSRSISLATCCALIRVQVRLLGTPRSAAGVSAPAPMNG
jgi:hypothetical protein